jgi:hypothetical protein
MSVGDVAEPAGRAPGLFHETGEALGAGVRDAGEPLLAGTQPDTVTVGPCRDSLLSGLPPELGVHQTGSSAIGRAFDRRCVRRTLTN